MRVSCLCVAASLLTPVMATPLSAQAVERVHFRAGKSSTVITDRIVGRQYKDYRVGVRADQTLKVNLRQTAGTPYFNVLEPGSSDVAIFVGSTSGGEFEARTAKSGEYTVRVYQMRADERRGRTAAYHLSIAAFDAVGGNGLGAPAHMRGDALVPGTPYHATAPVRCKVDASARWGNCKAGVIRRSPTSATVHLDTFDGGERTILFRDRKAVSSDSANSFRVQRRDDMNIISIGEYEVYEIPDALPFGG